MRSHSLLIAFVLAGSCFAQEAPVSSTEQLRITVAQWVETMRKIQQEENEWARDEEVLKNYREGLSTEIETLKEKIAEAKTRKESVDSETLEEEKKRDELIAAKEALTKDVLRLEQEMLAKLPLFPTALSNDPKVAQWMDELKRTAALEGDKREEDISKRLMNVLNLLGEAEKFQTTVHLREELHSDSNGNEYNLQIIYFGLACAYGVNASGDFAVHARPGPDGWKFEEQSELAPDIQSLIAAINGDEEATFINLPLNKP